MHLSPLIQERKPDIHSSTTTSDHHQPSSRIPSTAYALPQTVEAALTILAAATPHKPGGPPRGMPITGAMPSGAQVTAAAAMLTDIQLPLGGPRRETLPTRAVGSSSAASRGAQMNGGNASVAALHASLSNLNGQIALAQRHQQAAREAREAVAGLQVQRV